MMQGSTDGPGRSDPALGDELARFFTPRPVPATARDRALKDRGRSMAVGDGLAATAWGQGPTVLMAHGWESRGTHWGSFVEPLTDAGFRVVAVDAPAHGDSPGETTHVLEYGLALAAIGRDLGGLAGVVGHSWGAAAAAIAASRGLDAERFVLLGGPATLRGVVVRWCERRGIAGADALRFQEAVEGRVGQPLDGFDLTRLAPGFSHPALIVHDRGDEEMPVEEAVAVAEAWPGSRLLLTQRYGHRRILLAKDVIARVVAFLGGRDGDEGQAWPGAARPANAAGGDA
ncbi:esterase [Aquisphaera giovannonii]|uniref:Esterase n=1 Tax=Aquisphaera giovannonii TaxID=406548 RepID=A0A5B9WCM4_9BACT|nr:alpha/beta hydrolase [Aquisphaera giovannonii]QEH37630.1 esterase [Aquisphaera giovannonii]